MDAARHTGLPVVVRRDVDNEGRIPVGVRGLRRDQRAAGWVKPENVLRVVSPEDLSVAADLLRSPFITQPPVQVALQLSAGVAVDVGHYRQHRLRAGDRYSGDPRRQRSRSADPRPVYRFPEAFTDWQAQLSRALCRADTQVDTPEGGFALAEWLRDGKTLLKRNMGRAR